MKSVIWAEVLLLLFMGGYLFGQSQPTAPTPEQKPYVFITDSQSWETRASGGGANGSWGAASTGGARPQTAEIIKTFGERCPNVTVNNISGKADYIVELDHEGGKGLLQHRNKVAVFERLAGDVVVSKSTLSLGGSVQEACDAITKHWTTNSTRMRAAAEKAAAATATTPAVSAPVSTSAPSISVTSMPEGADIEIDGAFVGNTPSNVEVSVGEHTVIISKKGFKPWQRKLKVSGGQIKLSAELETSAQ